MVKAFPTRLPYQDIENRTYLNVLYEYLSANLPYNNLGKKKLDIYACAESRRLPNESRFVKRVSFLQTSLVSSNESRFVKWVSLCQTSLVSWNEPRFDSFRFSRTNESRWKSFIEWLINRDDLKSSGFPETVSDPFFLLICHQEPISRHGLLMPDIYIYIYI